MVLSVVRSPRKESYKMLSIRAVSTRKRPGVEDIEREGARKKQKEP